MAQRAVVPDMYREYAHTSGTPHPSGTERVCRCSTPHQPELLELRINATISLPWSDACRAPG